MFPELAQTLRSIGGAGICFDFCHFAVALGRDLLAAIDDDVLEAIDHVHYSDSDCVTSELHFPPGLGVLELDAIGARLAGSPIATSWDLFGWPAPRTAMAGWFDRYRTFVERHAASTASTAPDRRPGDARRVADHDPSTPSGRGRDPGSDAAARRAGPGGARVRHLRHRSAHPRGGSYRPELPFVMGHEPVGRVVAAGSRADGTGSGDASRSPSSPGTAPAGGACPATNGYVRTWCSLTGVLRANGGFAERLVVRTAQALALPETLSDAEAASLVDAGATAANSVRVAKPGNGTLTVVVGGGPIGFLCAELLRARDCEVVVVQTSAPRRRH